MTIQVAAPRWVPPFAQGYVRDLRVRWALEEAELPYHAILIDSQVQASASYRRWQPFGQVPAYKDDDIEMFESGAIVLHIAAKSEALTPSDEAGSGGQLGDRRAQFHRAARAELDSLRRRDLGERDFGERDLGKGAPSAC